MGPRHASGVPVITISPAGLVFRDGVWQVLPGMPAEVFVQTHTRTPLQYLLKPLREQIARTFRER